MRRLRTWEYRFEVELGSVIPYDEVTLFKNLPGMFRQFPSARLKFLLISSWFPQVSFLFFLKRSHGNVFSELCSELVDKIIDFIVHLNPDLVIEKKSKG